MSLAVWQAWWQAWPLKHDSRLPFVACHYKGVGRRQAKRRLHQLTLPQGGKRGGKRRSAGAGRGSRLTQLVDVHAIREKRAETMGRNSDLAEAKNSPMEENRW